MNALPALALRRSIGTLSLLLALVGSSDEVFAGTARAAGMAGTVTAVADGVEGARANPANLGLRTNPGLEIELITGQFSVGNNGIDLDLYNRTTGRHLSDDDKYEILRAIPVDGWTSEFTAGASALGVQTGRLAFTFTGTAQGYTTLPRDVFELLLMGNAVADSLDFEQAAGEAYSVGAARMSGAVTLLHHPWGPVHFGVGMAYLHGVGYARLDRMEGQLVTRTTGISGQAQARLTTATTGAGFGLDLGLATELGPRWRASLALHNAVAQVHYDGDVEVRTFVASLDTLDIATIEEIDDPDDLYSTDEFVEAAAPFTVNLPRSVHLGLARVGMRTRLGVEYVQGFEKRAGTTTTPIAALGLEWKPFGWLPLRTGVGAGGRTGQWASAGFGLHFPGLHLDFAATSVGEWWPGSPKGVAFAAGVGLSF